MSYVLVFLTQKVFARHLVTSHGEVARALS